MTTVTKINAPFFTCPTCAEILKNGYCHRSLGQDGQRLVRISRECDVVIVMDLPLSRICKAARSQMKATGILKPQ